MGEFGKPGLDGFQQVSGFLQAKKTEVDCRGTGMRYINEGFG